MKIISKQNLLLVFSVLFVSQVVFADEALAPAEHSMSGSQQADMMGTHKTNSSDIKTLTERKLQIKQTKVPEEMAGFSRGTVARSVFTTLIDHREPVDKVKQVPQQKNDIIYFTELRDMTGQTAKHRWEFKGKIMSEVKFKVRGPRWRVWSKKSFTPGWAGDWKVSVINGVGDVISEEVIAYAEPTIDKTNQVQDAAPSVSNVKDKPLTPAAMEAVPDTIKAE